MEKFVSLADMLKEEKDICKRLNELSQINTQEEKENLAKQLSDLQKFLEHHRRCYYICKYLIKDIKRTRAINKYGSRWCQDCLDYWHKGAKEDITKVRSIEKQIELIRPKIDDNLKKIAYQQKLQELKDIRKQIKTALDCLDLDEE